MVAIWRVMETSGELVELFFKTFAQEHGVSRRLHQRIGQQLFELFCDGMHESIR